MIGEHWQIGMLALQGLNPCHLIQTNRPFTGFGPFCGLCIDLTSFTDFFFSSFVDLLGQPIPEPMRLEAPFLRSRAACRGEIWVTMPRLFNSSAISLPVH